MKGFFPVIFDPTACRAQLDQLHTLLSEKTELAEREDILPLFHNCPQLTAFVETLITGIGPADLLAYEFDVFGEFAADVIIGNSEYRTFCAIEFEDARANSVLAKSDRRATKEWGRRFERGFGQLVDWFFAFDDTKNSAGFARHFGYEHVEFFGMLVIGRTADLSDHDRTRLRWRSDRVSINSHKVYCRTYDELYSGLDSQWRLSSLIGQPPSNSSP